MAPNDNQSLPNDAPMTAAVSSDGRSVSLLTGKDGMTFNRFWLRDACPSLPAKQSGLRTSSVASLPIDLRATSAQVDQTRQMLAVDWSDGHRSEFKVDELVAHTDQALGRRPPLLSIRHFDASHQPNMFSLPELGLGSVAHHDLLQTVAANGFAAVGNMSPSDESTEVLAALLGRVRETDFGRIFNIVTEPEAWTLSQSNKGQDPHCDDPFRYTPSGISILHCRQAAVGDGGASILVDGFKVADDLRQDEPEAFELLSTVTIPYVRHRVETVDQGQDVNMVAYGPVISVNRCGEVMGVRFHERSIGLFDLAPEIIDAYYVAFRSFATRVRSSGYQWVRQLGDGQAVVFDNQRVLHGRSGYEADTAGRRHMRLCTVDRDQVHSRLRRLRETLGLPGVDVRFPSGAMAD